MSDRDVISQVSAVFQATYADIKTIKTRKVVQFVLEVAQEQANHALECLGGLPRSDVDTWVAVARIQMPGKAPEPKKKWHELKPSQQAGIRCADLEFQKWIGAPTSEDAAVRVRQECDVDSRSELDYDIESARRWQSLDNAFLVETGRVTEQR